MQRLAFRLTGTRPLIQHNERLANPLNEHTRKMAAISKKRGKTEADILDMARIEFEGGLYFDEKIGPYVMGLAIERALLDSAKREKLGQVFKAYVLCEQDQIPLQYEGPRDIEKLWKAKFYDQRMVKVQQTKVLRTRPQFPIGWMIEPIISYDENALDKAQMVRCMQRAGDSIGMGDFRPRFGRFSVELVK